MTARPERQAGVPALFPEGIVAGRFRIVRILGVGGTGTVFEAVDDTNVSVSLSLVSQTLRQPHHRL